MITDRLRSYGAAKAEVLPCIEHCQQKYKNNRAENSHQPTRLRERVMRRFKSEGYDAVVFVLLGSFESTLVIRTAFVEPSQTPLHCPSASRALIPRSTSDPFDNSASILSE
jgi:DDE domain